METPKWLSNAVNTNIVQTAYLPALHNYRREPQETCNSWLVVQNIWKSHELSRAVEHFEHGWGWTGFAFAHFAPFFPLPLTSHVILRIPSCFLRESSCGIRHSCIWGIAEWLSPVLGQSKNWFPLTKFLIIWMIYFQRSYTVPSIFLSSLYEPKSTRRNANENWKMEWNKSDRNDRADLGLGLRSRDYHLSGHFLPSKWRKPLSFFPQQKLHLILKSKDVWSLGNHGIFRLWHMIILQRNCRQESMLRYENNFYWNLLLFN